MKVPVPNNSLVAMALIGALLTGGVAYGLSTTSISGSGNSTDTVQGQGSPQETLSSDVPSPNQNFTPAVQEQPTYDEEEYEEEYEEEEEHEEREYEEEDEEH